MTDIITNPQSTPRKPTQDWRFCAAIGLAIGVSIPISNLVQRNLTDRIGEGWAFGASLLATGVAAGLVSAGAMWLLKRKL